MKNKINRMIWANYHDRWLYGKHNHCIKNCIKKQVNLLSEKEVKKYLIQELYTAYKA